MNISVIVPTKNRIDVLLGCIKSLLRQSLLPDEVIILDQSDDAQELVIRNSFTLGGISLVYIWDQRLSGLTAARNAGLRKAQGDIVVFLDDDVVLDPEYMRSVVDVYLSDIYGNIGGVGGIITNFKFSSRLAALSKFFCFGPWNNKYNFWYSGGKDLLSTQFLSGCNMSYRKHIVKGLSFDEWLTGPCIGEDLIFSYQVSRQYRLVMTPHAKLQHLVCPIGRNRERITRAMGIVNNVYFFTNYVDKSFRNLLCFICNLAGLLVLPILSMNRERIHGVYYGLMTVLRGKKYLYRP